jgi:hypothetical protein
MREVRYPLGHLRRNTLPLNATLETDAILDQVRAAASSSWAQFQAAKERIVNAQVQLKAAETALTGIREQWALGDRTMREVLDVEQEFVTAEISLIIGERDRVVANAIARAVGSFWHALRSAYSRKRLHFQVVPVVRPTPVEKTNKLAIDCGRLPRLGSADQEAMIEGNIIGRQKWARFR